METTRRIAGLQNAATAPRRCTAPFAAPPRRSAPRRCPIAPASSSSKNDEIAALQNFKSGLEDTLKAAAKTAAAEAAAAEAAAAEAAAAASGEPDLAELDFSNFWSTIKGLPDGQLSVVMCYTQKCMPCKTAKPQVIQWCADAGNVNAYKFALTLPNKEVALGMGVKSSPTFLFFKSGGLLETMRGAASLPAVKAFINANK